MPGAGAVHHIRSRHNAAQQKGACRGFAGHLLLFDPVQAPPLGHAFESVNAAILKADSRLRHQILDRARNQDLTGTRFPPACALPRGLRSRNGSRKPARRTSRAVRPPSSRLLFRANSSALYGRRRNSDSSPVSNANRRAARLFLWTARYRQTKSWRARVRARRHDWHVGAGSQYFQPAVHSDGCVAARLQFLHSLWHAAPCCNELFFPVAEASSRSFAHLLRHGLRRRPTSGKPPSQPDEPTMPLTCIRKRSTDGLQCEGTWACAWGRWQDRSGIPRIECGRTFLRWQQLFHIQSYVLTLASMCDTPQARDSNV